MKPLAEGKTKIIYPATVVVRSKDRVTWGNRWEADMPGKAVWSTTTTCSVFELFRLYGQAVGYFSHIDGDGTEFAAPYCEMVPLEVVGRSVIDPAGSYAKRHPQESRGVVLDEPIIEFFLKTSGKKFKGIELPDDDPLVIYPGGIAPDGFYVTHPASFGGTEAVKIPFTAFGHEGDFVELVETLRGRMRHLTIILRDAWAALGWQLGDWKGEFGFDYEGKLLLADVIDNDSWRLRDENGLERSKQTCRDYHRELWESFGLQIPSAAELQAICDQTAAACAPNFALVADMSKRLLNLRPTL